MRQMWSLRHKLEGDKVMQVWNLHVHNQESWVLQAQKRQILAHRESLSMAAVAFGECCYLDSMP